MYVPSKLKSSFMATMSMLLILIGLFHLLGFSCSAEHEGWKTVEIACNCSNCEHIISTLTPKTELVFADCANGTFHPSQLLEISHVKNLRITGNKASVIDCEHNIMDIDNINTGISFMKITKNCNLILEDLKIRHCSSIKIANSSHVKIKNITIENSRGTGLVLVNNTGAVQIMNSIFQNSKLDEKESSHPDSEGLPGGGGLKIMIREMVTYTIKNCRFENNNASSGGGMFVIIHDNASNTNVTIQNSNFIGNKCHKGGGGLLIGYGTTEQANKLKDNSIVIKNCTFLSNEALYGGGTAVFSILGPPEFSKNKIGLENCSWISNTAGLGMAVDISIAPSETFTRTELFPSPEFVNCVFSEHNYIQSPRGVLSVVGFLLKFKGEIIFNDNNATAIEATSAVLDFNPYSSVKFINNQGVNGGALKLRGLAVIFVRANSIFLFDQNKARVRGGAIYVESYDEHSSKSCFIQYREFKKQEQSLKPQNVSFNFTNNSAGITNNEDMHRGDSVYATTLTPCLEKCTESLTNESIPLDETMKCIGNFTFDKIDISTAADHFSELTSTKEEDSMCSLIVSNDQIRRNLKYNHVQKDSIKSVLHFIPGKMKEVPLKLVDEFCNKVLFKVSVTVIESKQKTIFVDSAHSIVTDNRITLFGSPHDSGIIQLSAVGVRDVSLQIKVMMDKCPPGYIHDNSSANMRCVCYSNIKNHFIGIERCDDSEFQVYVKHGYWVGYSENCNRSLQLNKEICPKGFCFLNASDSPREHPLPSESGIEDLSPYICSSNRIGVLCGSCNESINTSAYYRSMSFSCKSNDLCDWGWVFYILSELIPITILFVVLIVLNISFTSGPLNGVVFFMQVVDTLKLDAENFISFGDIINVSRVHKFVYRFFNLNPFAIEELSFCLWSGASALDMLAFRYVTITYSLFLVVATIFFLRVCGKCSRQKKNFNFKHSIIHGLSTFLVMSYSECTRVSLLILTVGTLNTITDPPVSTKVAFYNGNYCYLGPEHLRYAIPAIFFIMTMVLIPPLLLLSYPLCYKLFALLRIEESRCVQITCKIFPLEKIKPLFDSIQGAFKDRYRFFSGLYFLYRLCLLLTFTYTNTLPSYYTITGIQLVAMLVLHTICQPYKKAWHNILDALLFISLALINILTFYNYQLVSEYYTTSIEIVQATVGIQAMLVLLPLVYLITYTAYHIVKRIKAACKCKSMSPSKQEDFDNEVIDTLDARHSDGSGIKMNNYILLGPKRKPRK